MPEFMLYIRNAKDAKKSLTEDQHLAFIKQCETYIGTLKSKNALLAAQPIVREGVVLKKTEGGWNEKDIAADQETQVGYYHIRAASLEEAIQIAKENPEFDYVPSATIEVRPVKTKEMETGFVYPTNS
ncbi:MAG TPA: YciI family protein [Leptospiraceae bacterium]|nr:YciI family protein [Leptospirales bacterium]HMU82395.1 YciI family protein [Leptospiraceae bacterium]HMW60308.1 YciI family protein [Leptospiraceae bacterium]HMX57299.1 YciI family protein [Leptospiraceae bacterium]HMY44994.1 YciI family protein [Leptospiraceae bacterium]